MPISINFLSNTRDVERGADKAAAALEEISHVLDDVARDAQRAGDAAGDGLSEGVRSGARDADRAASSLDFADVAREGKTSGDRAGDALADGIQQGVRDAERATDKLDFRDLAKDAERAGDKAGDGLSDGIKDGAKDAERSTERLTKSFEELRRDAARAGREGGQELGDGIKAGARRAEQAANESAEEIRDEFKSNLSEVTSSFRGDLESIGDLVQGTLGGLVSGLGPVGLAVGAAGALGIGLVMGATEQAAEKTEQYKARVAELTDAFIASGEQGELGFQQVADKLRSLATEGDEVSGTLADILERADKTGVSVSDLTKAFTGNEEAIDRQIAAAKDIIRQYDIMAAAAGEDTSKLDGNLAQRSLWAKTSVSKLEEVRSAVEAAQENERLYLESGAAELEAKAERTASYADSIAESLTSAGEDWEEYQDKETGALNLEAYNANIEARVTAMENYRNNMQGLQGKINADALAYLESLGADAAPLLQAYVDAPNDQQARTAANWSALGRTAASSYTGDLKSGIPGQINGPTVVARVDSSAVDNYIAGLPYKRLPGPTFFAKLDDSAITKKNY